MMRAWKAVLLASLFFSMESPVYAAKPSTGTGSFTSTSTITSMRTAGGVTFLEVSTSISLTGSFTGTCTGTQKSIVRADGRASFHGICTFTGSVNGKSGTLMVRYQATGVGASFHGTDVTTDGTGDLAGMHSTATFQGMATGATTTAGTYTNRVHFSPS